MRLMDLGLWPPALRMRRAIISGVTIPVVGKPVVPKPMSYSDKLKNNRASSVGWDFTNSEENQLKLHFRDDDLRKDDDSGKKLVGFFAGRFPGMEAVKNIMSCWPGKCSMTNHRSGWLIFQFQSQEERNLVLEGGPYAVYGRPLMLKRMPRLFTPARDTFTEMPICVQLSGMPMECWSQSMLGMIASCMGNPLHSDGHTAIGRLASYARILVQVDITQPLLMTVHCEHNSVEENQEKDNVSDYWIP